MASNKPKMLGKNTEIVYNIRVMIQYKIGPSSPDSDKIRQAVFLDEQGFSSEFFPEQDKHFTYITAYDENKPIGVIRYKVNDEGFGIIGRLAVLKAYRKQKIARQLMLKAEHELRQLHVKEIHLHAQQPVMPFYEQLGYKGYSEIVMDEFMPHQWMKKELTDE